MTINTAGRPLSINHYTALVIVREDGLKTCEKFYVIKGLPFPYIAGRRLLRILGYRLEKDKNAFHHPSTDDHMMMDASFVDLLDYGDFLYNLSWPDKQLSTQLEA